MTPDTLKADQIVLLRQVLENRAPAFADELVAKTQAGTLARAERLQVCELIGAEFAENGIGADSEPTLRGQQLETILNVINRPSLMENA
jgi:hypothetical protein